MLADVSARIFLVDDQALVRAGFRMLIEAQPDMEVVGEADDGRAALEALAVTRADLVLMDVRMPHLDGVQATERLLAGAPADRPPPKVIVLTTFDLDEYVFAAIRAGASGFLLKDARPEELLAAVRDRAQRRRGRRPQRHPPPARARRRRAARRRRRRTRGWSCSRRASARSCSRSRAGARTPRSAPRCSWPRRRSRRTSGGCWPSSTSAIASSSPCSRTRPASCAP